MASRRKGRILAFQALYSWDLHYSQTGETSIPDGLFDFSWNLADGVSAGEAAEKKDSSNLDEETAAFSRLLIAGTVENISSLDSMIQKHLKNWDIRRLNKVDLAVLRMSAYSLMFQPEIPPSVVIDEAIDISRDFGTDDSYRFVNGVLDGILKTLSSKPVSKPGSQETSSGA